MRYKTKLCARVLKSVCVKMNKPVFKKSMLMCTHNGKRKCEQKHFLSSQDSSIGSNRLGTGEVLGSNPSKGESFSVKISNSIVRIWIQIYHSNMYSALWYMVQPWRSTHKSEKQVLMQYMKICPQKVYIMKKQNL